MSRPVDAYLVLRLDVSTSPPTIAGAQIVNQWPLEFYGNVRWALLDQVQGKSVEDADRKIRAAIPAHDAWIVGLLPAPTPIDPTPREVVAVAGPVRRHSVHSSLRKVF